MARGVVKGTKAEQRLARGASSFGSRAVGTQRFLFTGRHLIPVRSVDPIGSVRLVLPVGVLS